MRSALTRIMTGMGTTMQQDDPTDDTSDDTAQPAGAVAVGENICPTCSGRGQLDGKPCPTCEGTGKVIEPIGGA